MDSRKRMGKDKDGVIFPVAPNLSEMSDSYLDFIEAIKKEIENQRLKVVLNANSSMICLYWNIGKAILQKQEEEGWGAKVIDRMAKDLKDAFPDMSGFSPRNIKYMRTHSARTNTSQSAGRILKLCNGSWHKFHGVPIVCCLTNWIHRKNESGMHIKPSKTVGAVRFWICRFRAN